MPISNDVMYISDGDDDDDLEIAFVGSFNLTKLTKSTRPVAIVLDDDSTDRASSPESEIGRVRDVMDLLCSDPITDQSTPRPRSKPSSQPYRADRKGKGRATLLPIPTSLPTELVSYPTYRDLSPEIDGIESPSQEIKSKEKAKVRKVEKVGKRKSEAGASGTKRIRTTSESESMLISPVKTSMSTSKETKEIKETRAEERARKQFEKDRAKADKEADKSFQRKLADANRLRTSKNDTLREIHLYLSSDLQLPSCPIAAALPEISARINENFSELHYLPPDQSPIPGVIKFKRHVKSRYDHDRKAWIPIPEPKWEWEGTVLLITTAEEVTDLISNDGLRDWVGDVRLALEMKPTQQLIIMIKGLVKYYSKLKSKQNKEYTAAARAGLEGNDRSGSSAAKVVNQIGREQIETELARTQMETKCFLVHVEKTEDMEDWIFNLAGDIAIRPYKLLSKAHLSFCATDGIKKGQTPGDVFELMLQEVQGITPSAAAGIRDEHESFQVLMEAYERAEKRGGRDRAEGLLQDCQVKNLRNGVASGRKLNKALSKRVYNVFRGQDSLALV